MFAAQQFLASSKLVSRSFLPFHQAQHGFSTTFNNICGFLLFCTQKLVLNRIPHVLCKTQITDNRTIKNVSLSVPGDYVRKETADAISIFLKVIQHETLGLTARVNLLGTAVFFDAGLNYKKCASMHSSYSGRINLGCNIRITDIQTKKGGILFTLQKMNRSPFDLIPLC